MCAISSLAAAAAASAGCPAEPLWCWGRGGDEQHWQSTAWVCCWDASFVQSFACMLFYYFNICGFAFVPSQQNDAAHTRLLKFCLCLPWTGRRYPPSSRQTSHEEGKEWLRSHSTGGLQDTGSQSPLSPPGASCTTAGKYHYSNLCRSTVQVCVNDMAGIKDVVLFIMLH